MLLDSARERDLFADLGARGRRELDLGEVRLDAQHASAGRRRADVDQEELALDELGHLCLLLVLRLDAQQSTQQEQTDLQLCAHHHPPSSRRSISEQKKE